MCVQNAGRSQMSTSFAEREHERRGLEDNVEILTGGAHPADHVHDRVVRAMHAVGSDISGQVPREMTFEETRQSDHLITMVCSAGGVCPAGLAGKNRD